MIESTEYQVDSVAEGACIRMNQAWQWLCDQREKAPEGADNWDIAPRAKANHREKVRRLYERLARVPLWRRKRARQQVKAKVSTYRKRWNIWAGALLLITVLPCASGEPMIIVNSGNTVGDTGSRFYTHGSTTAHPLARDYGGLCLTASDGGCRGQGVYAAAETPIGWGLHPNNDPVAQNLVLVPQGTIRLDCPLCFASNPQALDVGTGMVTTRGGSTYFSDCPPVAGNTGVRATWYSKGAEGVKGCNGPWGVNWTADDIDATLSYDVTLAAYSLGHLSPGTLALMPLYAGLFTDNSDYAALILPAEIIVAGLNCNMTYKGSTNDAIVPIGDVLPQTAPGARAGGAVIDLTIQCGGTNAPAPTATTNMGVQFIPGPGMAYRDKYKLVDSSGLQPGFYGTVNTDGGTPCSTGLPLDGSKPDTIHTYTPGESGGTHSKQYTFNLCSTGLSQNAGEYAMRLTARLVNY